MNDMNNAETSSDHAVGQACHVKRELSRLNTDVLQMPQASIWTVGQVERKLLGLFPAEEAEEWDRTGLLVGDCGAHVSGIVVALDPTLEAVRMASALGANVLLTHHPAFLQPPACIMPVSRTNFGAGAVVWEAVRQGVALMNFHTVLDMSERAARILPGFLHLNFRTVVDVRIRENGHGYGQLCHVKPEEEPLTLRRLAARATSVFGRQPRVWGDMDKPLSTVVTCTGSQAGLAQTCLSAGYDALVCGEIRYHDALDAQQAGLAIIELGHDVSELPLCAVLVAALKDVGFPDGGIKVLDQGFNWCIPEATRR